MTGYQGGHQTWPDRARGLMFCRLLGHRWRRRTGGVVCLQCQAWRPR